MSTTTPRLIPGPIPAPAGASTGAAAEQSNGPARASAARPQATDPARGGRLHRLSELLTSRRSGTPGDAPRATFRARGADTSAPVSPVDSSSQHRQANYGPAYSTYTQPNPAEVRYGATGMRGPGGALTAISHGAAALAIGVLGAAAMSSFGFFPVLIGVAAYSYIRRAHHYNLAYGGMGPYGGMNQYGGMDQYGGMNSYQNSPQPHQAWQSPNQYQAWQPPNQHQAWQPPNQHQAWQQPNPYQAWQEPDPYQAWQQPDPYHVSQQQPVMPPQARPVAHPPPAQPRPNLPPSRPRHAKPAPPPGPSGVQVVVPEEETAASRAGNASSTFWAGGNGVTTLSGRFSQPTAQAAGQVQRPKPGAPIPGIVDEGDRWVPPQPDDPEPDDAAHYSRLPSES